MILIIYVRLLFNNSAWNNDPAEEYLVNTLTRTAFIYSSSKNFNSNQKLVSSIWNIFVNSCVVFMRKYDDKSRIFGIAINSLHYDNTPVHTSFLVRHFSPKTTPSSCLSLCIHRTCAPAIFSSETSHPGFFVATPYKRSNTLIKITSFLRIWLQHILIFIFFA